MNKPINHDDLLGFIKPRHDSSAQRALEVGKAGEHLVCADLILNGYRAYLSDQGLPYDVVIDLGSRLIRVQVKTTYAPKPVPEITHTRKYLWHVRRAGKGAKKVIGNDEFEILALVALNIKTIAYLPIDETVPMCIMLRPPGTETGWTVGKGSNTKYGCVDEHPIQRALGNLKHV